MPCLSEVCHHQSKRPDALHLLCTFSALRFAWRPHCLIYIINKARMHFCYYLLQVISPCGLICSVLQLSTQHVIAESFKGFRWCYKCIKIYFINVIIKTIKKQGLSWRKRKVRLFLACMNNFFKVECWSILGCSLQLDLIFLHFVF